MIGEPRSAHTIEQGDDIALATPPGSSARPNVGGPRGERFGWSRQPSGSAPRAWRGIQPRGPRPPSEASRLCELLLPLWIPPCRALGEDPLGFDPGLVRCDRAHLADGVLARIAAIAGRPILNQEHLATGRCQLQTEALQVLVPPDRVAATGEGRASMVRFVSLQEGIDGSGYLDPVQVARKMQRGSSPRNASTPKIASIAGLWARQGCHPYQSNSVLLTLNQRVQGSNPCTPTNRSLRGCLETFGEGGWPGRGVIPDGCRSQSGQFHVDPGHPSAA